MVDQLQISSTIDVEKDAEASSAHSSSSSEHNGREPQSQCMPVKTNNEAFPTSVNEPQNEGNGTRRTLSRMSTKSSWKDPGPPPDGGLSAWTQCAMGHLVMMNTWGFINSFGVFQTYYVTALSRPPSDISWVGSIQVFLLFFIGTFTGRLTDAGYFRAVFLLGTILQVLGIFATSFATQYWQLFLAQGVCVGLGNGCLFTPMLSLVSTYFSSRRSLAIGIAACGSAVGGVVFPAMVQQLLPRVGFGWTIRALGFLELACLVVANILTKQRLPPRRTGPIVEWAAFKELTYLFFAIGMFFTFWGVYFAFYYLSSFSRAITALSYTSSINLLLVLNGVGALGRLLPNYLADRFGPLNVMLPITATSGLLVYCMIAVHTQAGLYVWAVVYGLFGAAIQSLFPAVLSSLTTDLRKAGVRMGMIFTIVSAAVLTGPPIEGLLIQNDNGKYLYAQIFAATVITVGCAFMAAARVAKSGWVWAVKM